MKLLGFSFKNRQSPPAFKTIHYRGGVVSFRLPTQWVESYEEEAGGIFYEDRPDSGTLRLNITTAKRKASMPDDSLQFLRSLKEADFGIVSQLEAECSMLTYTLDTEESGQRIRIYYWHIASPAAADYIRVASYSFTVATMNDSSTANRNDLEMLRHEIPATAFSSTLGK
jgi:hypothetical protein